MEKMANHLLPFSSPSLLPSLLPLSHIQYDKEIEQLEAEINPALDDDPQVALSYLFTKAIDTMKSNPEVCVARAHDYAPMV